MQSRFERVVVIGYGKTACDVLGRVAERQKVYDYKSVFIEYESHGISEMHTLCQRMGVEYRRISERQKVAEALIAFDGSTLVISAGNTCLFPRAVVEKSNLEIINFHSALLPKYPGRNTQSWAIYEGEKVTGATWHYMVADVDSGSIIAQRETPITEDIKAYELTRDIMAKASEAFYDFYDELLVRHIEGRPQPKPTSARRIYYSWELPGGGVRSLDDPADDIYRMLRAMDYGKNDIFPPAQIRLSDGREVKAIRYKKVAKEHLKDGQRLLLNEDEKRIYIALDEKHELTIKFN